VTEDQLIHFIAGLPGVRRCHGPVRPTAPPELAWGDSFFFYDPEGDEPEDQRLPFATIVTQDYDGFDMASKPQPPRDLPSELGGSAGFAFGQLVGYPPAPTCRRTRGTSTTASWTAFSHIPCTPAQAWVSILKPERQDERIGRASLIVEAHRRAGGTSPARRRKTNWYHGLPLIKTWRYSEDLG